MTKSETTQSADPKPRWGIILSGTFLALILVIAVVLAVTKMGGDAEADQTQGQGQNADAPVLRDDRRAETDRLGRVVFHPKNPAGDVLDRADTAPAKGDDDWTTARPDVEWQRLSGQTEISIARDYPFSAMAGPWQVTDGLAHGFAHTPQGAALAGIHAALGTGQGGQDGAQAALHFINDSQAREAIEWMSENPDGPQMPETPWTTTFAAYSVLHYDDDTALIRYAMPSGEGYLQLDLRLAWVDGDWRLNGDNAVGTTSPVTESEVESWVQL